MLIQDDETLELRETFTSLQQEVEAKTKKLKKVRKTLQIIFKQINKKEHNNLPLNLTTILFPVTEFLTDKRPEMCLFMSLFTCLLTPDPDLDPCLGHMLRLDTL